MTIVVVVRATVRDIRTAGKTEDRTGLAAVRPQDDDAAEVFLAADPAQDVEAVNFGHLEVEQDQLRQWMFFAVVIEAFLVEV